MKVDKNPDIECQDLFMSSINGICFHKLLFDSDGQPIDYEILDVNPSYEKILLLQKKDIIGKSATEVYQVSEPPFFKIYLETALEKKNQSFESYYPPLDKYFLINVYSNKVNYFTTVFQDITESKIMWNILQERERFLSTLIENLPGFAYRCRFDKHWTMVYVSKGFKDLTGYESEDVINNKNISFNNLIRSDFQRSIWDKWSDTIGDKNYFVDEYPIVTKNSTEKWVWEKGRAIYKANGEIDFLEGFITDISSRKKNEIARAVSLMKEKQRTTELESLLKAARIILKEKDFYLAAKYVFSLVLDITRVNAGFFVLLENDQSRNEGIILQSKGLNFESNTHKTVQISGLQNHLKKIKNTQICSNLFLDFWDQYLLDTKDCLSSGLYSPIIVEDTLVGLITLLHKPTDFTLQDVKIVNAFGDLISLAYKNWKQRLVLKENERMKDQFVSLVSHELRTPLMAIQSCLRLLQRSDTSETVKIQEHELINICSDNCQRLAYFINEVLDFQKIKGMAHQMEKSPIHIGGLVERAIRMLEPLAAEKNITIENNLSSKFPIVHVNEEQISQLIVNIIHNAIKHSQCRKIVVNGTFSLSSRRIELSISDNGVGIKKENVPRIFSTFTTFSAEKDKVNSSGLGLAICKKIVEKHNGKIWVESQLKKGSTFYIQLPLYNNSDIKVPEKY